MAASRPQVFTIPPHVAFVDALAAGLLARGGGQADALADAVVLLPNRRAVRALTEAFVRQSDGRALLLPRMTPVGDVDEDEALGSFVDDLRAGADMLPAIDPCNRRLLMCQLVRRWFATRGEAKTAVECLRLADQLAKAFDQVEFETVDRKALRAFDAGDLAEHWQKTLAFFTLVMDQWPLILADQRQVDTAVRRNDLMRALVSRWQQRPPAKLVVAAGMTGASPVVAKLLGTIARLPNGMVVLPGLDTEMPVAEWDGIRCHLTEPDDPQPREDSEAHPQFGFRCLLQRMGVAREEVETWSWTSERDGSLARSAGVAAAMKPAAFTDSWASADALPATPGDPWAGVRLAEAANPTEEAQLIALAMRRALETPRKTAALVTPDRALARRVAAQLRRHGVLVDDSAGIDLSRTPPGSFMLALAEAGAQRFAPVQLLALLKHPLVQAQEGRQAWLDRVRALDRNLRGVRPAPGLDGVAARLAEERASEGLRSWWAEVSGVLEPVEALFDTRRVSFPALVDALRAAGASLAGDGLWRGQAGRALSAIVEKLEEFGGRFDPFEPADAPPLLGAFLSEVAVRPLYGRHPRLSIWGALEARLQRADLMILGGLNEGVWPGDPAPDPWLAPKVRASLFLPGLERTIGFAAHDFVQALGGREVLLTRAKRDTSAPTVPSRFWLRLNAYAGGRIEEEAGLLALARAIDRPASVEWARRPAFAPPASARPTRISVTQAEMLKADPYSFYAGHVLGLRPLDPIDADPTASVRGQEVHDLLEEWVTEGSGSSVRLLQLAEGMIQRWSEHPQLTALWAPRVRRIAGWAAAEMERWAAEGWQPALAEAKGTLELKSGVRLHGRADRVDVDADGLLAIVDYKTGQPPKHAQLEARFALQLGLLAWIAEEAGFVDKGGRRVQAPAAALRFWRLSGGRIEGEARDPLLHRGKPWESVDDHVAAARAEFLRLASDYLLGGEPFVAKLHPEYSTRYRDYDHLARVDEWLGRGGE